MARIGPEAHLVRKSLLALLWLEAPQFFALVPPVAQWEIHSFCAPAVDLSDEQVLAHIAEASRREPSLPNRVGKHRAHFSNLHSAHVGMVGAGNWPAIRLLLSRDLVAAAGPDVESVGAGVHVFPVVRPEIDMQKLARTFLELGRLDRDRREADEAA